MSDVVTNAQLLVDFCDEGRIRRLNPRENSYIETIRDLLAEVERLRDVKEWMRHEINATRNYLDKYNKSDYAVEGIEKSRKVGYIHAMQEILAMLEEAE